MSAVSEVLGANNPFTDGRALANSNHCAVEDGRLVRVEDALLPMAETVRAHEEFQAHVLAAGFSCVGARSALLQRQYGFGLYGRMASEPATAGLARDLCTFVERQNGWPDGFSSYIACFSAPAMDSEESFERLLWEQLQALHDEDRRHFSWDASASADPHDPTFSFSFARRAFFVVGLHPHSSRRARRFPWPAMVFNARIQFDRLREDGRYTKIQGAIRTREMALQGSVNPMLSDFGERSEARQYSGRAVEDEWECPFQAGPRR